MNEIDHFVTLYQELQSIRSSVDRYKQGRRMAQIQEEMRDIIDRVCFEAHKEFMREVNERMKEPSEKPKEMHT
ncbi:MAG: hypothetical protein ACYSR0_00505 [Planctomycetota bacterium]